MHVLPCNKKHVFYMQKNTNTSQEGTWTSHLMSGPSFVQTRPDSHHIGRSGFLGVRGQWYSFRGPCQYAKYVCISIVIYKLYIYIWSVWVCQVPPQVYLLSFSRPALWCFQVRRLAHMDEKSIRTGSSVWSHLGLQKGHSETQQKAYILYTLKKQAIRSCWMTAQQTNNLAWRTYSTTVLAFLCYHSGAFTCFKFVDVEYHLKMDCHMWKNLCWLMLNRSTQQLWYASVCDSTDILQNLVKIPSRIAHWIHFFSAHFNV